MKQAIIFDLDGTLWNVLESTHEALKHTTTKHNIDSVSLEQVIKAFGTNKEETAEIYFPNLPLEEGIKLVDENTLHNIDLLNESGGILYPNVSETIKILSKYYSLYIVSNCGLEEYIDSFLIPNKLTEYFEDKVAASYLGIPKYEAILKVIKELKETTKMTMIIVTHEMEFAKNISDKITTNPAITLITADKRIS